MSAQGSSVSRRQVITSALGAGFALAVQPVTASTLSTSAEGLVTSEVKVPTSKGELPAFLAKPKQGERFPIVLVVHEIFGVHEHIKDVCRRLARAGYLAIAPDLFARHGDVLKLESIDEIRKIVNQAPDAQVLADLDATLAVAEKNGGNGAKLGITGFCWGGRTTWLYAAHQSRLRAGVAWYGRLVGDKDAQRPRHPVDVAAQLKAPVLGLYGGQDSGIPLASVEQMRAALAGPKVTDAARRSQIHVYPEAGHAFLADYRPSYRAPDAADGWKRMLAWFEANGVKR